MRFQLCLGSNYGPRWCRGKYGFNCPQADIQFVLKIGAAEILPLLVSLKFEDSFLRLVSNHLGGPNVCLVKILLG